MCQQHLGGRDHQPQTQLPENAHSLLRSSSCFSRFHSQGRGSSRESEQMGRGRDAGEDHRRDAPRLRDRGHKDDPGQCHLLQGHLEGAFRGNHDRGARFLHTRRKDHQSANDALQEETVCQVIPFKALRLPYHLKDDTRAFSMIVLPHEKDGLREMEAKLNIQSVVEDLSDFGMKMPMSKFQLPKFKIPFGAEVSETLKALGMELVFGNGADLSNMTGAGEALRVSSVRQKAFVEVNEKGTEATAVTTVIATRCSAIVYEKKEEFVADHPFMFLIKEEFTNTIIFTG